MVSVLRCGRGVAGGVAGVAEEGGVAEVWQSILWLTIATLPYLPHLPHLLSIKGYRRREWRR